MFEPRKLRPFSIEYCSAPSAVMTEMTEKTPMVIPNIVRPERNLFTPNEPSDIVIVSLNCIFRNSNIEVRNKHSNVEIHASHFRTIAPKIFINWLASDDRRSLSGSSLLSTSNNPSQYQLSFA